MKYAIFIALALLLVACGGADHRVAATLQPLEGSSVTGTAKFRVEGDHVRVDVDLTGLKPGKHGFHVHEWGDCTAPDGKSAGDHFNPGGHEHGAPGPKTHAGDLGNLEANAGGRATATLTLEHLKLEAGERGILGRSLVVHAEEDDLVSQPAGDSGGRVACGVIRVENGVTEPVLPAR